MARRSYCSTYAPILLVTALAGVAPIVPGCNNEPSPAGFTDHTTDLNLPTSVGTSGRGGGAANSASGGAATRTSGSVGGRSSSTSSTPCLTSEIGTPHDAGNYDFMSCNAAQCHGDHPYFGGWVYVSPTRLPWVSGATVTVTNSDGSTAKALSGEDGFFYFQESIKPPYEVCVTKCSRTDCNITEHTDADCMTSGCHSEPKIKVYVRTDAGTNPECEPPKEVGPYVHIEPIYGSRNCVSCHSEPELIGGYLYDGPTSRTTVSEATITITPSDGDPIETVTGPDGMFFFGKVAYPAVPTTLGTPYTACVSKCDKQLCSLENGHTTADDCRTCHDGRTESRVYVE